MKNSSKIVPTIGWAIFICLLITGALSLVHTMQGEKTAQPTPEQLAKFGTVLVALATAIERFWETVFHLWENIVLSIGAVAGTFQDWIKSWLTADQDVPDINTALSNAIKSPRYIAFKKLITLVGSLLLGLVASFGSQIFLFNDYGFPLPHTLDLILTGVILGAGAEPVHQIIGALQSARDAFAGLAGVLQGTAVRQAAQALRDTQAAQAVQDTKDTRMTAIQQATLVQRLTKRP